MQTLSIAEDQVSELITVPEGEHMIVDLKGGADGPTLIVFGSIHGNEKSGVMALLKAKEELEARKDSISGRVLFLAGNTRAINRDIRYLDSDLNRHWTEENVRRNSPSSVTATTRAEDSEQRELLEIIDEALKSTRGEVYALDLHSTSSKSTPFAMIGDTLRNRSFATKFPITFLLGIEEQLDGTILEYMNNLGAVTLGFEAGQHTTGAAVRNQESLVWAALHYSGILKEDEFIRNQIESLAAAMGKPRIIEIRYRHAISPSDGFVMNPGYANFQPVSKGEILAKDKNGIIMASETGLILMPLYQTLGEDGFFLGRQVAAFWLRLSRILRSLKIGNLMRFLPGVRNHPEDPEALIVNTRIARILPLQIFHLLGFRKRRWRNDQLVVSRRKFDTESPFGGG